MRHDLSEIVDTQSAIISLQSEAISELFNLLMEHITTEEADALPTIEKINAAARLADGLRL